MKKIIPGIIVLLIIAVILVFSITPIRIALLGISPRYHFVPEKSTSYDMNTHLKMTMETENLPDALKDSFPVRNMETSVHQTLNMKTDSLDGNIADVTFTARVEDMSLSINGESADELIQTGQENSVTLTVAPTGKIISSENQTELNVLISSLQLTALHPLPETAVKPGARWTQKKELETKPGFGKLKLTGDVEYTFIKLEKFQGATVMRVNFSGQLTPAISSGGPISIKGDTKVTGYYLFDVKAEEVATGTVTLEFDNHINLQSALSRLLEKASSFKIAPRATLTIKIERKQ